MAGTGPEDLQALAEELLAASVDALDTIPTFAPGLAGAPERSYVSPGLPSFDFTNVEDFCEGCEQLTVHVASVNEMPIRDDTHKQGSRKNIVTFVVTATRCIPTIQNGLFPTAAEIQAAAEQTNADGWALWNHIWNLIRSGDLFSLCGPVSWDGLRAINPSGGCGGYTLTLRAEVEGYRGLTREGGTWPVISMTF